MDFDTVKLFLETDELQVTFYDYHCRVFFKNKKKSITYSRGIPEDCVEINDIIMEVVKNKSEGLRLIK